MGIPVEAIGKPIRIDVWTRSSHMKKSLKKLKKEERRLSRKRKGSMNKDKQRIEVAKAHERVINQRDDLLHKISAKYINNYDFIAVKDEYKWNEQRSSFSMFMG